MLPNVLPVSRREWIGCPARSCGEQGGHQLDLEQGPSSVAPHGLTDHLGHSDSLCSMSWVTNKVATSWILNQGPGSVAPPGLTDHLGHGEEPLQYVLGA